MEILAIIPARGGSKSIPRKNVRLLAGEPLIAYAIAAARGSRSVTRVVVTTEDQEIASVARRYGAEVPFARPAELAGHGVTDLPVFQHCLRWLEEHESYRPAVVVHLRPTAPLRRSEHIDRAVEILLETPEADSVRSVCPAGQHPLKMWSIAEGALAPFVPPSVFRIDEPFNMPRQVLPAAYVQNGAVDVIRTEVILEGGSMSGGSIAAYVMEGEDSVNIDSLLDWELAEILMARRKAAGGR